MSIKHHLSDTTLAAYTAGALMESTSLVIASHLSVCPSCQARRQELETIGGIHIDQAPAAKMSADAFQKTLIKLGKQETAPNQDPTDEKTQISTDIPSPLRDFVPSQIEDIEWKSLAPGIQGYPLEGLKTGKGTLSLLKIAPGMTIPEHGHQGIELTMVLRGSFSDEVGQFGIGDIADLDESTQHQPIADTSEDCICLIATEASLKFTGLMPRLVQYFTDL